LIRFIIGVDVDFAGAHGTSLSCANTTTHDRKATTMTADVRIEVYEARKQAGQFWRWRALAKNNRKIASSGEAYSNKADCIAAVRLLFDAHSSVVLRSDGDDTVLRGVIA
jgi:uncharacterized protein YegP (UPF0339 family)